ncbi:hypothetical protein CU098_006205, partial [Rhizopus stolonifer]
QKIKLIPLQDEPHPPRKRNNSLIPPEFIKANPECAALATVFGVPEYIDSKSFWERKKPHEEFPSFVDSVLGPLATFDPVLKEPSTIFALPQIPTVSDFHKDVEGDMTPSSTVVYDFSIGSPEIFDFISSDRDQRFIIWGPDPIALSSSLATCRPSTYATLYNNQHLQQDVESFSSNTTTNTTSPNQPTFFKKKKSLFKRTNASLLKKAFKKKSQELQVDIPQVIEAATIHKLIEKLTNTLDYTFMTDFFLTYRDFIQAQDLCQLLVSRFIWALKDNQEPRKIVRIRTFVLLRHWLSNYFVHDFLGNFELRVILTDFLNSLSHHPLIQSSPFDQRIVKTLKRVVRRLKRLYYCYNNDSNIKIIDPPPPTLEQQALDDKIRAKLAKKSDHHGNMADARFAPVLVVGSLGIKSPSTAHAAVNTTATTLLEQKDSLTQVSHDSLDSDITQLDHDEHWLREQEETIEYFNNLSKQTSSTLLEPPPPVIKPLEALAIEQEEFDTTRDLVGLSRKLSRKSIERQKSIKNKHLPDMPSPPPPVSLDIFNRPDQSFEAIAYEQTEKTLVSTSNSEKQEIPPPQIKQKAPSPLPPKQKPEQSRLVSLIAEQLRVNMSREEIDQDRRRSFELRRRRGASISDGPVYLGQLDARSIIDSSQKSIRRQDSNESISSLEKSLATDAQAESIPRHMPNPSTKSFILSYRTSLLASQLCLIERDVLVKVGWEELIHCRWTKMDSNGKINYGSRDDMLEDMPYVSYTRQLEKKKAEGQGIEHIIQRFNLMCLWVPSEIVKTSNLSDRVKLIEKFIRLAMKCKLYSNYATLVQILLGLQSPSIARLTKTWSKVSPKYQKQLNKLAVFTSPMKNWKHIRDSMTEVAEEYGNSPAQVQVEMPGTSTGKKKIKIPFGGCIPFLGIYLSDLVFNSEKPRHLNPNKDHQKIYSANTVHEPDCLDQPLVNFRKYRVIATVIKRVLIFQGLANRYWFDEIPVLKNQCKHLDVLDATMVRELGSRMQ